ncbi:MAG TPA: glutamate synthase [Acidilobales archaeon]|nr:MAG: glutamate synthase [Desulfurococcales archaeon ex4484_42]HDD25478.1 glutamate synthase [Acidilobales archaeon]
MKFVHLCKTKPPSRGKKILIIGAGPAGLAAAGFLVCQGYDIDMVDKLPLPGGLMTFGIPEIRIKKERVMEGIKELSDVFDVKFILRTKVICCGEGRHEGDEFVSKKVSFNDIVPNYDATLIATGTWLSRPFKVSGANLKGVYPALEYLIRLNAHRLGFLNADEVPKIGKKVAIIGGGLTAVDAAFEALEQGAEVYMVYRRTKDLAPAGSKEIDKLIEKGVKFMELVNPKSVIGEKDRVKGLELIRMRLGEPDASGRPRPIPIPGTEFILEVDTVIYALGELSTPPCRSEECCGIKLDKWGGIIVDENFMTTRKGVFAAGDVVTGPSLIGKAMGSGLKAARAIHKYLSG